VLLREMPDFACILLLFFFLFFHEFVFYYFIEFQKLEIHI
jgi:hypothetical protein